MNKGKWILKGSILGAIYVANMLPVFSQIQLNEPDSTFTKNILFEHYKKKGKYFSPDSSNLISVYIYKNDYSDFGFLEGKFKGANNKNYFFQTDQIFRNCYFEDITFKELNSGKFLAAVNKDYLLELYGKPKNKTLNSISEVLAWGSAITVLFSPLITIDYRKGEFLERRYFAINRISLPVFAASLSLYFATDSRKIRISNNPGNHKNNLYRQIK